MKRSGTGKIALEFAARVRSRMKSHPKKIILFGSRARGDSYEGSDYDFLIVLDERNKNYMNSLLNIGVDFLNKYDVLIADIVCDEKEWENKKRFPLGLNILKEGIEL